MIRFLALLFILLPYGVAIIDGNPDEWTEGYLLGRLHVPDPDGAELASLYGMTDCQVMDFAVLADTPGSVLIDPEESWIKVGPLTYEDVTYINPADGYADGFEIEVPISAVHFTTTAHTNAFDGQEVQTVRSDILDLRLDCATNADVAWFKCAQGDNLIVGCAWETLSEIGIVRFDLYRNAELLAQIQPKASTPTLGALYAHDDYPGTGNYTYSLTTVYLNGHMEIVADRVHVRYRVYFPYVGKDGPHGK